MINTGTCINLVLCAVLLRLLSGCTPREPQLPVPVEQLATQIYLPIGTTVFHLPLIALVSGLGSSQVYQPFKLSSESKVTEQVIPIGELITKYSAAPDSFGGVAYAEVSLNTFSYLKDTKADAIASTTGLCPLLKQKWAFELCHNGLIDGWNAFTADRFILMDEMYLRELQPVLGYYSGRLGSVGDDVLKMAPYTHEPKVFCGVQEDGQESTLCTVVMRLDQRLLAIWVTNDVSIANNGIAMGAKSIRLFLEYGAGDTESYETLRTRLRDLHGRGSVEQDIKR